MFARGLAMQPLLDMTGIQYDARKFNWIGSISSDVSLVLSWHNRPFKTIDDVRKNEMVVAGTCWTVARPLGRGHPSWAVPGGTWEDLLGDSASFRSYNDFRQAVHDATVARFQVLLSCQPR